MEEEEGLKHLVHSKPWLLVLLQTWMADRAPLVLPKDHKRRYLDREEDLANQRSAPNAAAVVADRETAPRLVAVHNEIRPVDLYTTKHTCVSLIAHMGMGIKS